MMKVINENKNMNDEPSQQNALPSIDDQDNAAKAPPQPATVPQSGNNIAPSPDPNAAPPPATDLPFNVPTHKVNLSAVYPEPVDNTSLPLSRVPVPTDPDIEVHKSLAFSNGYALGGTIFGMQLIAGIVLSIMLFTVDAVIPKAGSNMLLGSIALICSALELVVLTYIPYSILKSNDLIDPLWLTLCGVLAQFVIVGVLFELVVEFIFRSLILHSDQSVMAHIGAAGFSMVWIVVFVAFLVAIYFLTKVPWGSAFSVFEKITDKMIIKVVYVAAVAVMFGGIAYPDLTIHRAVIRTTQPAPTVQEQTITP
jgi:hypothetical protein